MEPNLPVIGWKQPLKNVSFPLFQKFLCPQLPAAHYSGIIFLLLLSLPLLLLPGNSLFNIFSPVYPPSLLCTNFSVCPSDASFLILDESSQNLNSATCSSAKTPLLLTFPPQAFLQPSSLSSSSFIESWRHSFQSSVHLLVHFHLLVPLTCCTSFLFSVRPPSFSFITQYSFHLLSTVCSLISALVRIQIFEYKFVSYWSFSYVWLPFTEHNI